jgi:hypothetical protein
MLIKARKNTKQKLKEDMLIELLLRVGKVRV